MKSTSHHEECIAKMIFGSVYPHYLTKVEKKGRTKEELHQVIEWLTGYNEKKPQELIKEKVTFQNFFQAASLNPNTHLITRCNLRLSGRGNRKSINAKGKVFGQIGG